jgi:hypothetical protein
MIKRRFGLLEKKSPVSKWEDVKLVDIVNSDGFDISDCLKSAVERFLPDVNLSDLKPYKPKIIEQADNILENKLQFFFHDYHEVAEDQDWLKAELNGLYWPADEHWSKTKTFDPQRGDIKFVWEPSRFAWVYTLARAYKATKEEKYAEKFWQLFESWLRANQPNCGPAYSCGQECAIRTMAMCFAMFNLNIASSSSVKRLERLYKAIHVHAARVDSNIDFAVSTRTNHSITESACIYTVGTLFPEMKNADRWKRQGKYLLESEGIKQIAKDGSYIQQSMNYHRLMLQDYTWVLALAARNQDLFSQKLTDKLKKASEFLYAMQDETSGRLPNYGANDGALIMPLSGCDYLDYRPALQASWALFFGEKLYTSGIWDEDSIWFSGSDVFSMPHSKIQHKSQAFETGGYYTLRNGSIFGLVRTQTKSANDRPGHIDPLHFDLWIDGCNVLRDCGSYKYYTPDEPELAEYFKSIKAHNTVWPKGLLPCKRLSKFTFYPLYKSYCKKFDSSHNYIEGFCESKDYCHKRKIDVDGDVFIDDSIEFKSRALIELRWNIKKIRSHKRCSDGFVVYLDGGLKMALISDLKLDMIISNSGDRGGFESLYYGKVEPVCTIILKVEPPAGTIKIKTRLFKDEE